MAKNYSWVRVLMRETQFTLPMHQANRGGEGPLACASALTNPRGRLSHQSAATPLRSGLGHFLIAAIEMGMIGVFAVAFAGYLDFHAALATAKSIAPLRDRRPGRVRRAGSRHLRSNLIGHRDLLLKIVTQGIRNFGKNPAIIVPALALFEIAAGQSLLRGILLGSIIP